MNKLYQIISIISSLFCLLGITVLLLICYKTKSLSNAIGGVNSFYIK